MGITSTRISTSPSTTVPTYTLGQVETRENTIEREQKQCTAENQNNPPLELNLSWGSQVILSVAIHQCFATGSVMHP
jgi:hypothetical protein